MKTLILASQSPRRSEILKKENYFFVSFPVYVSEIPNKNLSLNEQIIDIARRKAIACQNEYLDQNPDKNFDVIILAADTMVCIDNLALGKAKNKTEAFKTLKKLSGRAHEVKTAIYLIDLNTKTEISQVETTQVFFKSLSDFEIEDYLFYAEYEDKAGSYAIQGIAKKFIDHIDGDYNNVVGLPIAVIKNIFFQNNWVIKHDRSY